LVGDWWAGSIFMQVLDKNIVARRQEKLKKILVDHQSEHEVKK